MAVKQSIPDVGMDLDSHTRTLKAIKEAVELGQGTPRDQPDTFITIARAVQIGLLGQQGSLFVSKKQVFADLILSSPFIVYNNGAPLSGFVHSYPGYYIDALGRVFLRGLISNPSPGTVISILPAGYRPQYRSLFSCIANTGADVAQRVYVDADGGVSVESGTFMFLSLDGISFAAFQ